MMGFAKGSTHRAKPQSATGIRLDGPSHDISAPPSFAHLRQIYADLHSRQHHLLFGFWFAMYVAVHSPTISSKTTQKVRVS
jgi:hypothetical protein